MNSSPPYRNPLPAVDIIIETPEGLVLIQRKNPPTGTALPGGFIEEGESAEEAARREAREETGLEVELLELLYLYSRPDRDPRRHVISAVFIARAKGRPTAGDDAARAFLHREETLPGDLVFDHREILEDYLRYRGTGCRPHPGEMRERHPERGSVPSPSETEEDSPL